MRTWKEIQMECLGLMFARTDGGNLVGLNNEDVRDYVNEMADAANYALRDLADTARPIVKSVEIVQAEKREGYVRYALKELAPDLMRLIPSRVFRVEDGEMRPYPYVQAGPETILLKGRDVGTFLAFYKAYPKQVTRETAENETLDLPDEALDLVPVYMAARLYKDDDAAIATQYLNEYHVRRSELIQSADDGLDGAPDGFLSMTGWC